MVLIGAPGNPSGKFHEAIGANKLFDAKGKFHGAYAWRDLNLLK
jgi:hypothetical protein